MQTRLLRYATILGFAALGAACRDGTGVDSSIRAAAGLYLLATVNGQEVPTSDPMAPTSGSIYLWPTGKVERHVTYRSYNGGTEDVESVGTFHFENGALVLELHPKIDPPPGSWKVYASLDDGTLSMGYPGPADGWIKEEYRRK